MTTATLAPPTLGGAAPDRAQYCLVLVHGRGGSATDIMGLGTALALPDLALAAPQAPGQSWWPTAFLAPEAQMQPFVEHGRAAIEAAIAALTERGLTRDRIALAGFSQGGCLALEYTARRGEVTGAFGFSAGLVGTTDEGVPSDKLYGFADKALHYDTDLTGVPVHISVHERDPHIPLKRAQDSATALKKRGAETALTVIPGAGHGITQGDLKALHSHLTR